MAQKKESIRTLKATIKNRQVRIEYLESGNRNLEKQRDEAREQAKKAQESRDIASREAYNAEKETSRLLFEVVRWLANRDTAVDPFNSFKSRELNFKEGRGDMGQFGHY